MEPDINVIGVYQIEQKSDVHLIELIINSSPSDIDVSSFTQKDEKIPEDNWQAAFYEYYLNEEGTEVIGDNLNYKSIKDEKTRMTFFMYFLDFDKPLLSQFGEISLPEPTALPERLKNIIEIDFEEESDSKEQCQQLFLEIMSKVKNNLAKGNDFYPIGEVVENNGDLIQTETDYENEISDFEIVRNNIIKEHKKLAENNKIIASGIAWKDESTTSENAFGKIIITIEHKDGYSFVFEYPIKKGLFNKIKLGKVSQKEGSHDIF